MSPSALRALLTTGRKQSSPSPELHSGIVVLVVFFFFAMMFSWKSRKNWSPSNQLRNGARKGRAKCLFSRVFWLSGSHAKLGRAAGFKSRVAQIVHGPFRSESQAMTGREVTKTSRLGMSRSRQHDAAFDFCSAPDFAAAAGLRPTENCVPGTIGLVVTRKAHDDARKLVRQIEFKKPGFVPADENHSSRDENWDCVFLVAHVVGMHLNCAGCLDVAMGDIGAVTLIIACWRRSRAR